MDLSATLSLITKGSVELNLENATLADSFLEALVEPLVSNKTIKKLLLKKAKIGKGGVKFLAQILEKNVVLDK
jgi:hypothetical protein